MIDLGSARSERRASQAAADHAALAGGRQFPDDPGQGCRDSWNYLKTNLPGLPGGAGMACSTFPATCNASTPAASYSATGSDPFVIDFRFPVPDSEITPARSSDGTQCERLSVTVGRKLETNFAGAIGVGTLQATGAAVSRATDNSGQSYSLLMLNPFGCDALTVDALASVRVGPISVTNVGGLIGLDSAGVTSPPDGSSGCGPSEPFTLDAKGSAGGFQIMADPAGTGEPGRIDLFAMNRGQYTCAEGNLYACDPGDVTASRIAPQPTRMFSRVTRAPVDHTYNCKSSYPDYHTLAIRPCPDAATKPPFIDDLVGEIGNGNTVPVPPGGGTFAASAFGCRVNPADVVVVPAGNWWVNCPGGLDVRGALTFTGGNVVFQGEVEVKAGGVLVMNAANLGSISAACQQKVVGCVGESSANASFVYFRNGAFEKEAGGAITLNRVFVYVNPDGCSSPACMKITGGASPIVWLAPTEGPFAELAIWSESDERHDLTGSANVTIQGVIFMPEALLDVSGSACATLQAQVIVYEMRATGSSCLVIDPDASTSIPLLPLASGLIR